MDAWDGLLYWTEQFAAEVDLEKDERAYKLAAAQRWDEALQACRSNAPDWPRLLRSAAGAGNFVNQYAQVWLGKALESRREEIRAALVGLADQPRPEAIDDFDKALRLDSSGAPFPSSSPDYISPGDSTVLASLVLMAEDPAQHPPYQPQWVGEWAKLVASPMGQTPRERYEGLLRLCDDFLERRGGLPIQDRLDAQGLAWTTVKYRPPFRWAPLLQAQLGAWRIGEDPATAVVARGDGVDPEMERGAWVVLGRGLRGETSAMDTSLTSWSVPNARELADRMNEASGVGSFMDQLEPQFRGAPDPVIVLLAELVYLRNAPLRDVGSGKKIARVNEILSWCSTPRELPTDLVTPLQDADAFRGGQGYLSSQPKHILWLARFVEHWTSQLEQTRVDGLRDPFAFRAITASTPEDVSAVRYVLEYLAWPGIFPSVVSANHRRKIHEALMGDLGEPSGDDDEAITRDLVALMQFHRSKGGIQQFHWYRSPYKERWNKGADVPPRAWLVRPGDGGMPLIEAWMAEGFVSLSAKMLGSVPPGSTASVVRAAVKEGYAHFDASQREAASAAYHFFLSILKEDDIVATIFGGDLRVGLIAGDAAYTEVGGSRLRRPATWSSSSVPIDGLPAPLPSLLDQQGAVVDITEAYDTLAGFLDDDAPGLPEEVAPVDVERSAAFEVPPLPDVTEAVAAELHMDREPLQEIVDLLQSRQQIVLHGPPGTGKTYVARHLARHLVGDPSRVRLVQFHPSYSYEDFFEGYRPTTIEGSASFALKDGPLKLLASEARNNRDEVFVLIIDEMNRANLAKVFGELYFLLEYRKETVRLQYQPETAFWLPPNLFMIGTMNTSDRSIALVDAAIRRRFPFYEMHPAEEPVRSVLGRYLKANGISDDRANLLESLNTRIATADGGGHDLQVGPSYLMRPEIQGHEELRRVWRYDILPLLEEHFYGLKDRSQIRAEFGFDALRGSLKKDAGPDAVDEAPDAASETMEA